jgi:transposase
VWCSAGRNAATLQAFFDELGDRRHSIRAVSIDMSGGYEKAIRQSVPQAEIAFNPFDVVRLGQRAVDQVRRAEWNAHERSHTPKGRWIKNTRWSLREAPDKQTIRQFALLGEVQQANKAMFRAFLLKEELRLLYQLQDPTLAPVHLNAWLAWASRSRLKPFVKLARTIRRHRAAIRLGLSNGRLEELNSRIRLISHRSFGFHSAAPLIATHLPVLRRRRQRSPTLIFTTKSTGAPIITEAADVLSSLKALDCSCLRVGAAQRPWRS